MALGNRRHGGLGRLPKKWVAKEAMMAVNPLRREKTVLFPYADGASAGRRSGHGG